jgi:hypothetical protein
MVRIIFVQDSTNVLRKGDVELPYKVDQVEGG